MISSFLPPSNTGFLGIFIPPFYSLNIVQFIVLLIYLICNIFTEHRSNLTFIKRDA